MSSLPPATATESDPVRKGIVIELPERWYLMTDAEIDKWRLARDPSHQPLGSGLSRLGRAVAQESEERALRAILGPCVLDQ